MTLNKCVAKGTTDILGLSKAKWRHKGSRANKILNYEVLMSVSVKGTVPCFVTPAHLVLIYFCFEVTQSNLTVQYVSKFSAGPHSIMMNIQVKEKGKIVPVYQGLEVQLHSFITSTLEGSVWSALCPGCFISGGKNCQ